MEEKLTLEEFDRELELMGIEPPKPRAAETAEEESTVPTDFIPAESEAVPIEPKEEEPVPNEEEETPVEGEEPEAEEAEEESEEKTKPRLSRMERKLAAARKRDAKREAREAAKWEKEAERRRNREEFAESLRENIDIRITGWISLAMFFATLFLLGYLIVVAVRSAGNLGIGAAVIGYALILWSILGRMVARFGQKQTGRVLKMNRTAGTLHLCAIVFLFAVYMIGLL